MQGGHLFVLPDVPANPIRFIGITDWALPLGVIETKMYILQLASSLGERRAGST